MLSPRSQKDALIFSQVAKMKFKPVQCPLLKSNKQQPEPNTNSQFQRLQSSISTIYSPDNINKTIKYLKAINQSYFLIGNQNQIDLIGINGASYGFLDTQYLWSLNLKQVILNIAIDTKKCFLALVLDKFVHVYTYNHKKLHQIPKLYKSIQTKSKVKFIQFAKQAYLSIFYDDSFEVYIMQQTGKFYKKCQKLYGITSQFKLFSVPQAVDSVLNIFFQKQTSQQKTFSLWNLKVVYELVDIKMSTIQKVYDIMKILKKKVSISNFSRDTFFLNMGCQIIAAKKGFIIDSINVNIQGTQSRLIYIQNQKLLHIEDNKVYLYDIKIDVSVKPNRMKVKSLDSLEIQQKPTNSKLIDVITFGKDNFAIFFQMRPQYNIYKKGEINYWFALTQYIRKQQKIKKIFNYGSQISTLSPQFIQGRCDMARKIGLQQKQIYLQIWNRTSKSTVQDYKFLLSTKDFKTIYNQIEKKLKKQSMSFRQLFNIFQSCLDLLTKPVFQTNQPCTEQNIQEYLTCHLLIRKLKLFKQVEMYKRNHSIIEQSLIQRNSLYHKNSMVDNKHFSLHLTQAQNQNEDLKGTNSEQQSNLFLITIQQFYEYKNMDLKGYIIDLVNSFCQDKKNTIYKIRLILRAFRFVYRIIYRQLLDQIIVCAKSNLLSLLQAIPELLPYLKYVPEDQQISLYEGIWTDITQSQWETNLHIERVKNIYNSQAFDDLIKSVWYKRYWLTTHDLITKTKSQILQIHHQNISQEIFYYFISSMFQKIQDSKNLQVLVEFVQNFYQNLPQHIKGKTFLYVNLWKYYNKHHEQAKRDKLNLNQFLKLKGQDLFKYYFDLQKVRKNSIFKQIKPIYLKSKSQYAGIDIFNQGLLQYFQSEMSELSDLKYLLNRMNNEKSQFHQNNVQTYQILVQAMQIKLMVGGPRDIPIQQILIYIQNIPLSKDNDVMADLETMQRINQQSQRFKEMRLNMSLRDIIDNCEDVISKIIQYEYKKHKIYNIRHIAQLKKISYSILAEVQTVKQKIYGDQMNNLPFFIYISQILQNQQQIDLAAELLKDQYLNRYFTVNETIIQNLVLYMYKKRFSYSSVFKDHAGYIRKLVTLLDEHNNTRQFIQNELQFALTLSAPGQGIQFPISTKYPFPKINELLDIVKYLPIDFILKINIQKVYQTMHKMQQIQIMSNQQQNHSLDEYVDHQYITKHQVYEIFIVRMIELNLIHYVIPYIREIIKFDFPNQDFNTLYLIMLILKIAPQLNDDTKHGLMNLVAYGFQDQQKILQIIEFYINTKMTSLQKGKKVIKDVEQVIKNKLNYRIQHGYLFKDAFIKQIDHDSKLQQNGNILIKSTWLHLRNSKEEFKNVFYQLVYIILCHQPYMLAKLIYLELQNINFKHLRCFISYLSIEQIFDESKVLEFAKRVFYLVLNSRVENEEINHKLFNYQKIPLDQNIFFNQYNSLNEQVDLKLVKSIKACQSKSKIVQSPRHSKRVDKDLSDQQSIHIKIHYPQKITQSSPSQYPHQDSDDDENDQLKSPSKRIRSKSKRAKIQFDQKQQRNKFMNRQGKKLGNYMKEHSERSHSQQKSANNNNNQPNKSFKIKSRITSISRNVDNDKDNKLKRAMSLSYNPQNSRARQPVNPFAIASPAAKKSKIMQMFQSQSSLLKKQRQEDQTWTPVIRRSSSKRKGSQIVQGNINLQKQQSMNFQNSQKQRSSYTVRQHAQLTGTQTTCQSLLEQLLEDYDVENKKFNLQKLRARSKLWAQDQKSFISQLKKLIITLYDSLQSDTQLKISMIKAIATQFEQCGVKLNVLSVYIQLITLLQRYNINLQINRILTVQSLLQQTSLTNLFEKSKQNIVNLSTIQNLSKLSKVVSLAFRKNIYEQQIAYFGLSKLINQLQSNKNIDQVQINLHFDQIHQIVTKFSTKMIKQKAQAQFKQIENGNLKVRLINLIIDVVANKGDKLAVNALKKALNLANKEN